jgi:hypothetical protein
MLSTHTFKRSGLAANRHLRATIMILGLAGLALLVACSPSGQSAAGVPSQPTPSRLAVVVASDMFSVGHPRIPFVIYDGIEPAKGILSITAQLFDLTNGTPQPGWSGDAAGYPDYDIPYWVVYPSIPHPGFWGISTRIMMGDGSIAGGQFAIQVVQKTDAPDIGDLPPASENRTLKTEPDLAKLTSDPAPEPALYQMTVAQAMASSRPSVVSFATPAFCTSRLCAPVVNAVKGAYRDYGQTVNFIHIEVYKTFNPLVYADEMAQWHLKSEPWTYVLDSKGVVVARFGGPVSTAELEHTLHEVTAK